MASQGQSDTGPKDYFAGAGTRYDGVIASRKEVDGVAVYGSREEIDFANSTEY
jgi:hypothetical protein